MECYMTSIARFCPEKDSSWFPWCSRKLEWKYICKPPCSLVLCNLRMGNQRLSFLNHASIEKNLVYHPSSRVFSVHSSVEDSAAQSNGACTILLKDFSSDLDESEISDSSEEILSKPLDSDKLKSLLADSERTKIIKKLSEANQHNRFLKRQLQTKEDDLINFKSELSIMELEVQSLVALAEEVANSVIQQGSRKINGKYIQSHLLSRLQALHEKLKEQIKDVDAIQAKEVSLFWVGMAESVQVMGSFGGWTEGEHLSPEYTGSFTRFSTTLMLRPGRYEIKFLVDGEWQLSPEFPTVGEGMLQNNLLIVE
ncbi:PREDICTED: protein PTST, chloroplastic [Nelumbo nucifera]|nr:PREDICTED: protein PTST, chloroplastic [Nelumbo nucifera]